VDRALRLVQHCLLGSPRRKANASLRCARCIRYAGRVALAIADKHMTCCRSQPTLLRRSFCSTTSLAQASRWCAFASASGRDRQQRKAEYVVLDAFVRRTDRGWTVEASSSTLARKANQVTRHATRRGTFVRRASRRKRAGSSKSESAMKLLKWARSIAERQTAFLEHEESMRPMIRRHRQAIDMHGHHFASRSAIRNAPRGVLNSNIFLEPGGGC
jgi:DNA-directed RNA polymerase specialized sigma54-like protein